MPPSCSGPPGSRTSAPGNVDLGAVAWLAVGSIPGILLGQPADGPAPGSDDPLCARRRPRSRRAEADGDRARLLDVAEHRYRDGARRILPFAIAAFAFGASFGVLAEAAGRGCACRDRHVRYHLWRLCAVRGDLRAGCGRRRGGGDRCGRAAERALRADLDLDRTCLRRAGLAPLPRGAAHSRRVVGDLLDRPWSVQQASARRRRTRSLRCLGRGDGARRAGRLLPRRPGAPSGSTPPSRHSFLRFWCRWFATGARSWPPSWPPPSRLRSFRSPLQGFRSSRRAPCVSSDWCGGDRLDRRGGGRNGHICPEGVGSGRPGRPRVAPAGAGRHHAARPDTARRSRCHASPRAGIGRWCWTPEWSGSARPPRRSWRGCRSSWWS